MSLFNVFNIAGSALNAETIRLNTTASNLANAESVDGDAEQGVPRPARRSSRPSWIDQSDHELGWRDQAAGGRACTRCRRKHCGAATDALSSRDNPKANKDGYVYMSNVNLDRRDDQHDFGEPFAFATNVEAVNTARDLLLKTISMGH